MTHTQDFEHVLDCENVVGVDYDGDGDVVQVLVRQKVAEEELDDEDIAANAVSEKETDVIDVGDVKVLADKDMPSPQAGRENQHRPVQGGVSECNYKATAATAGPWPARVTDTSVGEWADSVEEGDRVRISNNHVYARINKASFGEPIVQPSRLDGGSPDDEVGKLAGYTPIADGATIDAAARTSEVQESGGYHETAVASGEVARDLSGYNGETVVKTGRTTGVTEGDIRGLGASIRVRYGEEGTITIRDTVLTDDMSQGGDSGSPAFLKDSGDLLGLVFAGSDKVSIMCKSANIENEMGVTLLDNGGDNFIKSLETVFQIPMEDPDLDLLDISGDKPLPGETVVLTATVGGNYGGEAWLKVQGERYRMALSEGGERKYTATTDINVSAPADAREPFSVTITGGYIL